jgi:hypothetical protein
MNNEFSLSAAREARIDRAIDRAVREMMHVDPPHGLRRRVLARLNESEQRRSYFLARYAFAAMAVVILMMSLTLLTERVEPPTPPQAPVVRLPAPAPAIEVVNQSEAPDTSRRIIKEPIRMPRVTNVFGSRPGEVSAATIDAGKRQIVVPSLKIVPLSARPIVVTPLIFPPVTKGGQ